MTILITGASAGFGAAMCETFVQAGYTVIGVARRQERLQALQEKLGAENFQYLQADIADIESIQTALQQLTTLPESFQQINGLINNAGLALGLERADKCDFADWATMIQTNIIGLTYLTHALLPEMIQRNNGYIINIGSIAGNYAYPGGNVYGATKAFVRQFSLNLRADLHGTAIRVSNIEPGLCSGSEFSQVRFYGDIERAKKVYENIDALLPEDIAQTALWLYQTPKHMNVNTIEIMPVAQSFSALTVCQRPNPEPIQINQPQLSWWEKLKSWF